MAQRCRSEHNFSALSPFKGVLRSTKETEPSDFPARVPPHDNVDILVVLPEISSRRARCCDRFFEYLRTHRHVLVLSDSSSWPRVQEILVVEEVHDLDPIGKYFLQTTFTILSNNPR